MAGCSTCELDIASYSTSSVMARVGDSHGKAPGLGTKELKSLDLLVQRTQRFDALFFCVSYAIIVGKVLRDTTLGNG